MTGRDLISASLRLIGAIAPGETPSASELTDGLASINRMVDSWTNDNLLIYSEVNEQFPIVAGVQSYTMGPTGTFNTIRPGEITRVLLRVETSTPAIEYPVDILSGREWASILQKEITSKIPNSVYIEGTYPLETLLIYPIPSVAYKLVIYSMKPIATIATIDTIISLPPGYEQALVFNGAVQLAPEYGRAVSQEIAMTATESKASIKRRNYKPSYLRVDNSLITRGSFNIYTGEFR